MREKVEGEDFMKADELEQIWKAYDKANTGELNLKEFVRMWCEKILPHLQNEGIDTANNDVIPDGFSLVGNSENPQHEWAKAIIDEVRPITHITEPDTKGEIIGVKIS